MNTFNLYTVSEGKSRHLQNLEKSAAILLALFLFLTPLSPIFASGVGVTEAGTAFIHANSINNAAPQVNSQNGSLNYSYPLALPPGRGEMAPDLALQYSSNDRGNTNIFGYGWSISIPHISRINRFGVDKLYTEDVFSSSLDGELIEVDTNTYRPRVENGSFREYTYSNDVWTIREKDGTTLLFGSTTQARRDNPSDSSQIYAWYVEEARDTNDNYIAYDYHKEQGQIYPETITYTGHDTTDGDFDIEFSRESRNDNLFSYETGFAATTTSRISRIEVQIDTSWVKRYDLSYTTGHNGLRSVLSSVTESGRDESLNTTTLPATEFDYETYGSSDKEWTEDVSWSIPVDIIKERSGQDHGARFVDFNGDSLPDILKAGNTELVPWFPPDAEEETFLHTGEGWATTSAWTIPLPLSGRFGFSAPYEPNTGQSSIDTGARFADVNNDGFTDILWGYDADFTGLGFGYDYTIQDIYINNGVDGWATTTDWQMPSDFLFVVQNVDAGGRIADVNGDGLPDLLIAREDSVAGASDINKVFLNTGNGWEEMATSTWSMPEVFVHEDLDYGTRMADVNGDGLADFILAMKSNGGDYTDADEVYINTGAGWELSSSWSVPIDFASFSTTKGLSSLSSQLVDVNGDGLVDLISSTNGSPDSSDHGDDVYINTGEGWTDDGTNWTVPPYFKFMYTYNSNDYYTPAGVTPSDVDGDNMIDFIKSGPLDSDPTYPQDKGVYLHDGGVPDLLSSITTPEGGVTSYAYEQSARYEDGSGDRVNPLLYRNLDTIVTTTYDDGVTAPYSHSFTYGGGEFYYASSTEHQFGGFATTTQEDARGNITYTYTHQGNGTVSSLGEYQDSYEKIGKPYLVERYDANDNLFTRRIMRWESDETDTDSYFVFNTRQIEQMYDGDVDHKDIAVEYSYATSTGNLLTQTEWGEVSATTTDGTFSDTGSDKRVTTTTYAENTGSYILGLPETVAVTDQSSSKVRESRFYYDSQSLGSVTTGNLTKKEDWVSDTTYIDTEWTYNSFGLPATEKDPRDKTTTFAYDDKDLYVATSTDAVSQTMAFAYDYSSGEKTQIVDQNGNTTINEYDGVDRITKIYVPDPDSGSSVLQKEYTYTDTSGAFSVLEENYLNAQLVHDSVSYFDGFGRVVQERSNVEAPTQYSVVDHVYGIDGLLQKSSLPYASAGVSKTASTSKSNLYTNFVYDTLDRVATTSNTLGNTTNTYDQWNETVTDALGNVKEYTYDAYKRLVSVDENNGASTYTTSYEWDLNDNLTNITDELGNERDITYDGLGRRLSLEDLHDSLDSTFGVHLFEYDASGNLSSTTNPNGIAINYTYDDINRVLTENNLSEAGTEVTFTYDSCTEGTGKLCQAVNEYATTTYAYNPLGLVESESKVLDGTTYTTSYEYDRQRNQTLITYPDSTEVAYTYNLANQLETIQSKEVGGSFQDIITDLDYGVHGGLTRQAFPNADTVHTYDEDAMYRLTHIQTDATTTATTSPSNTHSLDLEKNSSQFLDISDVNQTGLDDLDEITVSAWIKIESLDNTGGVGIVSKGDAYTDAGYSLLLHNYTSTDYRLWGQFCGTSNCSVSTSRNGATNLYNYIGDWVHVAMTWVAGSTNEVKLYVNGVEESTGTFNNTGSSVIRDDSNTFRIGASKYNGSNNGFYDGKIDDVRVWDIALSESAIAESYEQELEGTEANLVGYWDLDNQADDKTINDNDLSENGGSLSYSTEVAFGTGGMGGMALMVHDFIEPERSVFTSFMPLLNETIIEDIFTQSIEESVLATTTATTTPEAIAPLVSENTKVEELFKTKNFDARERANIKSKLIVQKKGDIIGTHNNGLYKLEILEVEKIGRGVQVLARAWKGGKQLGFGKRGDVDVERFNIFNPPLLVEDKQGDIQRTYSLGIEDDSETVTKTFREDPSAALIEVLFQNIKSIGKENTEIKRGRVGNTTSTFFSDAHPETSSFDGNINKNNGGTWSATRDATSAQTIVDSVSTASARADNNGSTYYKINRGIFVWDTSSISDTATVDSATIDLQFYVAETPSELDLVLTSASPASDTGLAYADFDDVGSTDLATAQIDGDNITTGSLTSPAFTLNASGLTNISKDGTSGFAIREKNDFDDDDSVSTNVVAAGWYTAEQGGTTSDPRLIVEHSGGGGGGIGVGLQNLSYTYDAVGNITQLIDHSITDAAASTTYEYDDLYRLTSASTTLATSTNYLRSYTYDALGNILTKTGEGTYDYEGDTGSSYANPHAATEIGTTTLAYDRNGNLTLYGSQTFTWDYQNRLLTAYNGSATSTYAYDHTGNRVEKVSGGTTTHYPNTLYEIAGADTKKYVYAGSRLVATIEGDGTATSTKYIHADHLNSTSVVTDADTGDLVQTLDYYPFGGIRIDEKEGTYNETNRYTGHEYDDETDFSYMGARYQSGEMGRFISQDPVALAIGNRDLLEKKYEEPIDFYLSNPQAHNSYSYALNNPLLYTDPDGENPLLAVAAVVRTVAPTALRIYGSFTTAISGYETYNIVKHSDGYTKDQKHAQLRESAGDLSLNLATEIVGPKAAPVIDLIGLVDDVSDLIFGSEKKNYESSFQEKIDGNVKHIQNQEVSIQTETDIINDNRKVKDD